ncbi:hypothetical protein F5884DRAFT_798609 [Xylogone sp. PMI_703]|nr:hypothetical protein F5884DRAFT_798609 [Xylogone sp. PMI_703]
MWGGPIFKEHVSDGTRPFIGSVLVVQGESVADVMGKIKKDIYVKEGIWDLEKMRIFPFQSLFRRPLQAQ